MFICFAMLDDIVMGNEIKEKYHMNETELREAFEEFDTDKSGKISKQELLKFGLETLSISFEG